MQSNPYITIELTKNVERSTFCSHSPELNAYFQTIVSQDIKRHLAKCFVLQESTGRVIGYYTLSAAAVSLNKLPEAISKRIKYQEVPVVRLGRLAIDKQYTGQGFGAALVFDALERIKHSDIATFALIADAKDDSALAFYEHLGFINLGNNLLMYPLIQSK